MPKERQFDMEDVGGRKTIIVLCVDTSNSLFSWQREVNNAIKAFFHELDKEVKARFGTEVAVVTYDTTPKLHCGFTTDKDTIKPIVIPDRNPSGGWTNIGDALKYSIDLAIEEWRKLKSRGVPVYLPWVILFTDGKPENKEKTAMKKMEEAISELQQWEQPQKRTDKLLFIGIGVGDDVDISLMRRISSHGRIRYLHADNFTMLSQLFRFVGATTVIANNQVDSGDDISSSFQHQAPTCDKPDLSDGTLGFMEESPTVFSSLGSDNLFSTPAAQSPNLSAQPNDPLRFDNVPGNAPYGSPGVNAFSQPEASAHSSFYGQAESAPAQAPDPNELNSLLEKMMTLSTNDASYD